MSEEREWLFRTHQHRIEGPFTRDELLDLAESEAFGPMDEICRANSHWISIRDRAEAEEALGEPLPFPSVLEEEDETTATDLIRVGEGGLTLGSPGIARQRPEAFTSRLSSAGGPPLGYQPRRTGQSLVISSKNPVETAALWKFMLAILVILAAFLFGALLRLIQPTPVSPTKVVKPATVAPPSPSNGIEVGSPPPRLDEK